jgi:hypothetical protein
VGGIEVNFEDFEAEFEYFEIKRAEWGEEILESLDNALNLVKSRLESVNMLNNVKNPKS